MEHERGHIVNLLMFNLHLSLKVTFCLCVTSSELL